MPAALTETQLREIEAATPDGLSSQELVAAFATREVKFTEATLRKYVQLGLVPRSRRVGRKGKHLGSRGIYPVRAVRRINAIKKLMADHYTIEEIQARFLTFKDRIEALDEAIVELVRVFDEKIAEKGPSERERLASELLAIRASSASLLEAVNRLEKLIAGHTDTARPRSSGVARPTELL